MNSASQSQVEHEKSRRIVIFSIVCVIALATPAWWYNTQVYRASLPVHEIRQRQSDELLRATLPVKVDTIFHDHSGQEDTYDIAEISRTVQKRLQSVFQGAREKDLVINQPNINTAVRWSLGISVKGSRARGDKWPKDAHIDDVRDSFTPGSSADNGHYKLVLACSSSSIKGTSVHLGEDRVVFVHTNEACAKTPDLLFSVIGGLFHAEHTDYRRAYDTNRSTSDTDWDSMRTMKYAPEYKITVSLLNGNSQKAPATWDVQEAVDSYIQPFLQALSPLSDFAVDSQIQYLATLALTPEKMLVKGKVMNIFRASDLRNFVNSAEWNLASVVEKSPPLNFLVFIPSAENTPLHLVKSNNEILDTNAFLMPRWGGVVIVNPDEQTGEVDLSADKLEPVMSIFLSQLRDLMGVKAVEIPNTLRNARVTYETGLSGITSWELDRLVRTRTLQNIEDTVQTLNSILNMIEQLEAMPVSDHIQEMVSASLSSLDRAKKALQSNADGVARYIEAAGFARKAVTLASDAFFDPTMVAMLYFPDEHKFAVYMPLFVPIAVPILVALVKELKEFVQRRKSARSTQKQKSD
ncbi:phosphatidylinositol-glycan biosynthesis class S protein [Gaertneriomyces semiglobifer]|nr:phosphatidylinositol-glycan biosynthesis class S protein [Gaertneriomyces semiglobifer]